MKDNSYEISSPDVVAEVFAGEVVVLNLENGKYFSLRGLSAQLWAVIMEGYTPHHIHEYLHGKQHMLAQASDTFLQSLIDEKLIRECERVHELSSSIEDLLAVNTDEDQEQPVLEIYDDMAELILSDPIHEVDEDVGWPRKRD